jgi:fructose-bisphosphate aldolase/6-deoxy-5-ketofructose 1-phosphate synthase
MPHETLMKLTEANVKVPGSVLPENRDTYIKNFLTATHNTGRLMLFAGDQKIEHLNKDFYGEGIAEDDGDPEHLFKIASQATIGAFATQLGLISRYGQDYKNVPYIVKLNSKTNVVKTDQKDPLSVAMTNVSDVVAFKKSSGLNIVGIGYTVYAGSEFESVMLTEAAQSVFHAHQNGLLSVIWVYPRGKAVKDEKDPNLIAGAAGLVACLGADFAKVNAPKAEGKNSAELLRLATKAAGRTGVVCAGGGSDAPEIFLKKLYEQIHIGGTRGNATGRNIHQKSLAEAIRMCNAISAITFEDQTSEQAVKIYRGE